jgi:hypothetical protein
MAIGTHVKRPSSVNSGISPAGYTIGKHAQPDGIYIPTLDTLG